MSLTQSDLQEIRSIVQSVVEPLIEPLANEIKALRSDIKEIYQMISELQSATITDKEFKKRSLEEKLLSLNAELLAAAKQAGITLPRN
jgi:prefoldin subunit 5